MASRNKTSKYFCTIIFIIIVASCNHNNLNVKQFRDKPEKSIDLSTKIFDIPLNIYFSYGNFFIMDSVFIIFEGNPKGSKVMHFFNNNNFSHIKSAGAIGKGPGEITPGASNMFLNSFTKNILVNDFGKLVIYKYPLDSLLTKEEFLPSKSIKMDLEIFLDEGYFLNDSIGLGTAIIPSDASTAEERTVHFNLNTNSISKFGFKRKDIENSDTFGQLALSNKNSIYVRTFPQKGLLDICDLQGNHLFSIEDKNNGPKYYESFSMVKLYKNYIITSMMGDFSEEIASGSNLESLSQSKFIVFDLKGNHVKTIKFEYGFSNWIADEINQRLIIYFNDKDHLLGYIDLAEILP